MFSLFFFCEMYVLSKLIFKNQIKTVGRQTPKRSVANPFTRVPGKRFESNYTTEGTRIQHNITEQYSMTAKIFPSIEKFSRKTISILRESKRERYSCILKNNNISYIGIVCPRSGGWSKTITFSIKYPFDG